ncbi:MAG: hypothetical protein WB763_15150 [Terriglobia bacterium]
MSQTVHPKATFEVRLVGPELAPERMPLRAVNDVLSAIQDLASGRDPFDLPRVPVEKSISLARIRSGSAVYTCVARSPREARSNLARVGKLLSCGNGEGIEDDGLIAALRPIELLSDVARTVNCQIEIALKKAAPPLFTIAMDAYQRISEKLLLTGETTVIGRVERAGGATSMRCLLRIPGRRRGLYCGVAGRKLVQRLGQHLYEEIAATGTATWIHRTWRIYRFTIRDFTQPRLGNPREALEELRRAGLEAWDNIGNPVAFLEE